MVLVVAQPLISNVADGVMQDSGHLRSSTILRGSREEVQRDDYY